MATAARTKNKEAKSPLVAKPLPPDLPYWEIYDGIVFLKNGDVEFGIALPTIPDAYLTNDVRLRILEGLSSIIENLPEKARLRFYYELRPASLEPIADYVRVKNARSEMAKRMYRERAKKALKEAVEGRRLSVSVYMTVHLPGMIIPNVGNVLGDLYNRIRIGLGLPPRGKVSSPLYKEEIEQVVFNVRQILGNYLAIYQDLGIAARKMTTDEVYTVIHRWLNDEALVQYRYGPPLTAEVWESNPDVKPLTESVVETPIYGTLLSNLYKLFPDGRKRFLGMYELTSPPRRALWDVLGNLIFPAPMFVVVDVYKMDQEAIKLRLNRAFSRKYRASNRVDEAPEASDVIQSEQVFAALKKAELGEHFVEFSMTLGFWGDSLEEMKKLERLYEGTLKAPPFGGYFRKLGEQLIYPYMNILPFSGRRQDMRFVTLSGSAAYYIVNIGPWDRLKDGTKPTALLSNRYYGLVPVDIFDPKQRSWNMVLVGSSGGGKTFSALYLISEMVATREETEVIIVDKKGDYRTWIELMGGEVIDIAPGSDTSINMFDIDKTFYEEFPVDIPGEEKLGFLQRMFHILLQRPNDPNLALKEQIWLEAVRIAYKARLDALNDETGKDIGYHLEIPTLQDVVGAIGTVESIGKTALSDEQKIIARQLSTELSVWLSGPLASFLNAPTRLKGEHAKIVYFNLEGLDRLRSDTYMALALALISERIYSRLMRSPRNVPKLIIFDEAHALFKQKEAADIIVDLYRRGRSYGASIWTLTQTIAEYKGPYVQGLLDTTSVFAFVNSTGQAQSIKEVLNVVPPDVAEEAERLERRKGVFGELLYIILGEGGEVVGDVLRITPTPFDYWLFTSNHEEVAKRTALAKEKGSMYKALVELAKLKEGEDEWDRLLHLVVQGETDPTVLRKALRRQE